MLTLYGAGARGNRRHADRTQFGWRLWYTVYAGGSVQAHSATICSWCPPVIEPNGGGAGLSRALYGDRSRAARWWLPAGITLYTAGRYEGDSRCAQIRQRGRRYGRTIPGMRCIKRPIRWWTPNRRLNQPADTSVTIGGPLLRERGSDSGKRADAAPVRRGMCWRCWPPALTTIPCPPTTTACPGPPW